MTQADFQRVASEVVIQAAFWSSLLFIGWYSWLASWWKYSVGRAIVALDSAIALATGPTVLGLLLGPQVVAGQFVTWLTVFAFGCIPVITIWRCVIVWQVQRRAAALKAGAHGDAG